jgi:hypothetical protein
MDTRDISGNINLVNGNLTPEEVHKLFLATDNKGRTGFLEAGQLWKLKLFQGIFNLAKRI